MPVTLRLMRLGKRKKPFYRLVVVDKRKKRTGSYIENIGTYNPLVEPAEVSYDRERFTYWVKQGALISEGLRKLLKDKKKFKSSDSQRV